GRHQYRHHPLQSHSSEASPPVQGGRAFPAKFLLTQGSQIRRPTPQPGLPPTSWLRPRVSSSTAAADVPADTSAISTVPSRRLTASAMTAAISASAAGDGDSANLGASSAARPWFPRSGVAVRLTAEGEFKQSSEAAAVPAADASPAVPAAVVANCAISVSPAVATAAAAALVSTGKAAPGSAASAASAKPVTATPASAASAAAASRGVAVSSRPTSSLCCCSCSRNAPPRRAAHDAHGDVLDAAVVRSGPAPRVLGVPKCRGWGDATVGAVSGSVSGNGDVALSPPDRPCARRPWCSAQARPRGDSAAR
ncbi:unnamed protein product, partial [Closterium sp. NIES-54]